MLALGLAFVLTIGIAVSASAAGWGGGGGRWSDSDWAPAITKLDLSDEQYDQLRELHTNLFNEMQDLRTEISQKVFELKNLYFQKNPDTKAIEDKKKELADLQSKIYDLKKEQIDEVNENLTQEQLAELGKMRGAGFRGKMGRGMGGFYNPTSL